jgi:hypothetical protein
MLITTNGKYLYCEILLVRYEQKYSSSCPVATESGACNVSAQLPPKYEISIL